MARDVETILGIEPTDVLTKTQQLAQSVQKNYDMVFPSDPEEKSLFDPRFEEDFEEVRTSLKGLIGEIVDGVSKLSLIAQESEKAAHFSALAQMSTTLLNANKQLLEIYSEKRRYQSFKDNKAAPEVQNNTQNNFIFSGTTNDLKQWIKDQIK
jgi:hypothetical protein